MVFRGDRKKKAYGLLCAQASEYVIANWRFGLLELRTTGLQHGN